MSERKKSSEASSGSAEKRKSVRLEINAVTRYIASGAQGVGTTKLINLGGVLMEVPEALALGSLVDLELNLPTTLKPFFARGEVVYRNNIRDRAAHVASEMGIKFTDLSTENESSLRRFTDRYHEFDLKHSVFSKEMSAFHDPTILPVSNKNPKK